MGDLISSGEMSELTGAKLPAKQREVLRQNGLRFTVRADGRPILTWEAYNRQMAAAGSERPSNGPRLEAV